MSRWLSTLPEASFCHTFGDVAGRVVAGHLGCAVGVADVVPAAKAVVSIAGR